MRLFFPTLRPAFYRVQSKLRCGITVFGAAVFAVISIAHAAAQNQYISEDVKNTYSRIDSLLPPYQNLVVEGQQKDYRYIFSSRRLDRCEFSLHLKIKETRDLNADELLNPDVDNSHRPSRTFEDRITFNIIHLDIGVTSTNGTTPFGQTIGNSVKLISNSPVPLSRIEGDVRSEFDVAIYTLPIKLSDVTEELRSLEELASQLRWLPEVQKECDDGKQWWQQ